MIQNPTIFSGWVIHIIMKITDNERKLILEMHRSEKNKDNIDENIFTSILIILTKRDIYYYENSRL